MIGPDIEGVIKDMEEWQGEYCGECGIKWREPSPDCPHQIHNLHPLSAARSQQEQRVTPSPSAMAARDRWIRKMSAIDRTTWGRGYHVTTICGSIRYYDYMLQVASKLTRIQQIVLMPYVTAQAEPELKRALDEMHKAKIRMSDSITVVGLHRGESTCREIDYAIQLGRPVFNWMYGEGQVPYET